MKNHGNALPHGYRLHWYRIESVLGQGGFGITYLAHDANLDKAVAIKEYLPIELAVREGDSSVRPFTEDRREQYAWGLARFIEEARTLANFDHPNIVRVHSVFEEHATAYMVMTYEVGRSLEDIAKFARLDGEVALLALAHPLVDALEHMHGAGFIHRDVKPANIVVRPDGNPVLLDFGSARLALGGQTRTLTSVVSAGFAPYEQYHAEGGKQGPWTDIYGLGATLYAGINRGRGPLDAIVRGEARIEGRPDPMDAAATIGAGRYSARLLEAIDAALAFAPAERPRSAAEFRRLLPAKGEAADPDAVATVVGKPPPRSAPEPTLPPRRSGLAWKFSLAAVGLAGVIAWYAHDRQMLEPVRPLADAKNGEHAGNAQRAKSEADPLTDELAGTAEAVGRDEAEASASSNIFVQLHKRFEAERRAEAVRTTPGTVFRDTLADGSRGPEMVVVPAGSFRMGDLQGGGYSNEKPVHTVRIERPFAVGRHEVTFDEYDRFARATGHALPDDEGWGRGRRPVISVSWEDAVAYARWLSTQTGKRYRLLSEAEWEYAARGGAGTARFWGNDPTGACRYGNVNDRTSKRVNQFDWEYHECDDGHAKTAPVGGFAANAFGLHDMLGNVWEWTADCWNDSYGGAPADGSAWTSGDCARRVMRGGSWLYLPRHVRSANRDFFTAADRAKMLGFRLAQGL